MNLQYQKCKENRIMEPELYTAMTGHRDINYLVCFTEDDKQYVEDNEKTPEGIKVDTKTIKRFDGWGLSPKITSFSDFPHHVQTEIIEKLPIRGRFCSVNRLFSSETKLNRYTVQEVLQALVEVNPDSNLDFGGTHGAVVDLDDPYTFVGDLDLDTKGLISLSESWGHINIKGNLWLGDNQLKTLPDNFGDTTVSGDLGLSGNELETLPESFGCLTVGGDLDLHYNDLETLPENFGGLKVGGELDLSNNKLKILPTSFKYIDVGGDVNLSGNPGRFKIIRRGGGMSPAFIWDPSESMIITLYVNYQGDIYREYEIDCKATDSLEIIRKFIIEQSLNKDFDVTISHYNMHLSIGGTELDWMSSFEDNGIEDGARLVVEIVDRLTVMQVMRHLITINNFDNDEEDEDVLLKSIQEVDPEAVAAGSSVSNLEDPYTLSYLDLSQWGLLYLPESFADLTVKHILNLSENHLTHLPENFGFLTVGEELNLSYNPLESLPESFYRLADSSMRISLEETNVNES